ncbi:MAG: glycosyltransferase family 2 protein [Planctomycetes bacterium]|nr:glycosyltransferase family 2 protein [Planctomycetota bacterium]
MARPEPGPVEVLIVCPVRDAQGTVAQTYVDVDRALRYAGVRARIVFVDRASGDRTRELLEEYRRKDPRIRVLALPEVGGDAGVLEAAEAGSATAIVVVPAPGAATPAAFRAVLGALGRGADVPRRRGGVWGYRRPPAPGVRVA